MQWPLRSIYHILIISASFNISDWRLVLYLEQKKYDIMPSGAVIRTFTVLSSTNITKEDRDKYAIIIAKFDAFFQVRKNVIFERAKFNRRNQKEGESAEQYITALYSLVETYEYGTLKVEMLRDRIVVGIRDT